MATRFLSRPSRRDFIMVVASSLSKQHVRVVLFDARHDGPVPGVNGGRYLRVPCAREGESGHERGRLGIDYSFLSLLLAGWPGIRGLTSTVRASACPGTGFVLVKCLVCTSMALAEREETDVLSGYFVRATRADHGVRVDYHWTGTQEDSC